jgi:hypothetical protein
MDTFFIQLFLKYPISKNDIRSQPFMSAPLQIRMALHCKNEDLNVEFLYDPTTDTVDRTVAELSLQVQMTDQEAIEAKRTMYAEIEKVMFGFDGLLDDAGYRELLARQREELKTLDERHEAEQRELLARAVHPRNRSDDLLVFE